MTRFINMRRHLPTKSLIFSILVLLLANAAPALAHAVLLSADPAPNAILSTAPTEVQIRFSEPVALAFSRIEVFTQSGQQLETGELRSANANDTALAISLPPLSNGTYLVSWEVLSTVDGHTTSGSFPFAVGVSNLASVPGANASTAQQPTPFSAGARWFTLTGLALLLGLFSFQLFVWRPSFRAIEAGPAETQFDLDFKRAGLRVGWAGAALLGAGLVLALLAQANRYNLFSPGNLLAWLGTRFGTMWLARLGLTAGIGFSLAALFASTKTDENSGAEPGQQKEHTWLWRAGLALSLGLALTISLISHSAALPFGTTMAVAVDLLHLIAAGVWAGGLLQLGLALWQLRQLPTRSRAWLNLSLAFNFSALAAGAVGMLLASGGYLAWQHVGSWIALFGTAYGLALLAKIGLACPAFGIAAFNLMLVKPRLEATLAEADAGTIPSIQRRFRRLVGVEALFALLVLASAGLLTDLQRAQEAPLLASQTESLTLNQAANDLNVRLTLDPALVGSNRFDIYLTGADGQPVADAEEVSLRFTFLGQAIGAAKAEATSQGDGHYALDGSYLSLVGPWQIEAAIRRPAEFDAFAPFRVEATLNGAIQPISAHADLLERLVAFLNRNGGLVTGVFLVLFAISWELMSVRASRREWQLVPLLLPGLIAFWIGTSQLSAFYRDFTPAMFTTNPILPDAGSIAQGRQLYETNCVSCHGLKGRGDGPAATDLSPPPADFTAGHTTNHLDGDLYYWIKEGIPDTAMPAFGVKLTDEELWHLVNYVRRLSTEGS